MKIIIAGGRNFDDYDQLRESMWRHTWGYDDVEIVSGGAKGADALGERWAKDEKKHITHFPADWDTHGKAAGFIRNVAMAEYANILMAFWDGVSKGTKHMIDTALKHSLEVHVLRYEPYKQKQDL